MRLGEKIKTLRKAKKWTMADLSQRSGLSKGYISMLERGVNPTTNKEPIPTLETVYKIANAFGVPSDTLLDNVEGQVSINKVNLIETKRTGTIRRVPVLGTISCGVPIISEENIDYYEEELDDILPSGNIFYLKTKGDSMAPTIPINSLVMIREQPSVENGEIAAVLVNGDTEATLKRVHFSGDTVLLQADNPLYPPYIVSEDNPARIIGKVIKYSVYV